MKQVVPDKTTLRRYVEEGLTQAQMVERWATESNITVSRSAIGMALARYGLRGKRQRDTYEDMLPWTIRPEHQNRYDAKMLRLEAKRRRGQKLSETEMARLSSWRQSLTEKDAVVVYDGETDQGWWWVERIEGNDDDIIRRP